MKRLITITFLALATVLSYGRQPQKGYRGFLEWSNDIRSENFDGCHFNSLYTGFSTSHGYQINPTFFVGAGLAMEKCGNLNNWIAPVFVQGRADFDFGGFTPFGDVRLGVNMAEGVGAYFSPTIGYRINWGRKAGVNLGVGLGIAGYKVEYYEGSYIGPGDYEIHYVDTKRRTRSYFSFRIGIDF